MARPEAEAKVFVLPTPPALRLCVCGHDERFCGRFAGVAILASRIVATMIEGMIAMAVQDDWISVAKAAKEAGCSEQFIRRDLLEHLPRDEKGEPLADRTSGGRLEGWLVNGRAWLVSRASAVALRGSLSTRATLHKDEREARQAKVMPKSGRKKAARRRKK